MSGLDFLEFKKGFNPLRESILLVNQLLDNGSGIKDFRTPERADQVMKYLTPMLSYSAGEPYFGACIVRESSVNVFTFNRPLSKEAEEAILARSKSLWNQKVQEERRQKQPWRQNRKYKKKDKKSTWVHRNPSPGKK